MLFVELLASIDDGGLIDVGAVEKTYHIGETIHPVDVEVVDNGSLTGIGLRHEEALELLLAGKDGYGQGSADGFQAPVETQFTNHHILRQTRLADLPVGG